MPDPLLLLPALMVMDAENAFAPFRKVVTPLAEPSDDFTILVPIYGHSRYFHTEDQLRPLRSNVMLVINSTTPDLQSFAARMRRDGWGVFETTLDSPQPMIDMLSDALDRVTTQYVIRLDGDTTFEIHPGCAVAAMRKARMALCSARVLPSRRKTLAEVIQGVEYDIAMISRRHRPWLTSGACILARTGALKRILDNHSTFFPGEDLEMGLLAKFLRMRVGHIDFTVKTDVPVTFRELFKQRQNWWAGSFRSSVINFDKGLRFPFYFVYNVILVWLLLGGRLMSSYSELVLLPTLFLFYTGLLVACHWSVRSRWMILYPYYSFAQVVVMPIFGIAEYFRLIRRAGRLGRYRVPFLATMRRRRPLLQH